MKKILVVGCTLVLLAVGSIYLFIPSTFSSSYHLKIACNASGGLRIVTDSANWGKWLSPKNGDGFIYRLAGQDNYITYIEVEKKQSSLRSRLVLVPMADRDSAELYWDFELPTGTRPIGRIERYQFGKAASTDMAVVLLQLREFLEKKENVYGEKIGAASTRDSFLVATRSVFNADPSTGEVYGLIGSLKQYIKKGGAGETGFPMLNITNLSDGRKQVEAAMPIDRKLRDEGAFYNRKLVPGHYLMTEVRGGNASVDGALARMQNYVNDHQKTIMAIPFFSLVTDRSREADTTKWVTRIYYPVY